MNKQFSQTRLVAALSLALGFFSLGEQAQKPVGDRAKPDQHSSRVTYNAVKIDGLDIFYREAGDPSKPTILLLHGFPTSSHMFRNLIPALSDSSILSLRIIRGSGRVQRRRSPSSITHSTTWPASLTSSRTPSG